MTKYELYPVLYVHKKILLPAVASKNGAIQLNEITVMIAIK